MPRRAAILGLTIHRPEMASILAEWMQDYPVIILEEPPDVRFKAMLRGALGIDDYIAGLDLEFPAFSRRMCLVLRELKASGKRILQIEPYIEALLEIHEAFAEGQGPKDISKRSLHYPVYLAERDATGALLAYYQTVASRGFEETLEALIRFARLDAKRFRLRDSLRAQALAPLVEKYPRVFVEAGAMHYPMARELNRLVGARSRIRALFLTDDALRVLGVKGHLFGPGDQLTLLYRFHSNIGTNAQARKLAAQAIVYAKLVEKEEITDERIAFPHIRNELDCIGITRRLSLADCRHLFPLIRRVTSAEARDIVAAYL